MSKIVPLLNTLKSAPVVQKTVDALRSLTKPVLDAVSTPPTPMQPMTHSSGSRISFSMSSQGHPEWMRHREDDVSPFDRQRHFGTPAMPLYFKNTNVALHMGDVRLEPTGEPDEEPSVGIDFRRAEDGELTPILQKSDLTVRFSTDGRFDVSNVHTSPLNDIFMAKWGKSADRSVEMSNSFGGRIGEATPREMDAGGRVFRTQAFPIDPTRDHPTSSYNADWSELTTLIATSGGSRDGVMGEAYATPPTSQVKYLVECEAIRKTTVVDGPIGPAYGSVSILGDAIRYLARMEGGAQQTLINPSDFKFVNCTPVTSLPHSGALSAAAAITQ